MEQQNNFDNSGSLFINDRKVTDKHPDYKGSIIIEGKKYRLSGWLKIKDKRDGSGKVSYISISAATQENEDAHPVAGFPTVGGMLNAAASLASTQQQRPAPRPAKPAAPAPAPAPTPAAEEEGEDLPF